MKEIALETYKRYSLLPKEGEQEVEKYLNLEAEEDYPSWDYPTIEVPTNFDHELLLEIDRINSDPGTKSKITGIYGAPRESIFGHGRAKNIIHYTEEEKIIEHVDLAHKLGLAVNYTMNAPCFGNREFTPEFWREASKCFEELVTIGFDRITPAHPLIMKIAKENYPELKVVTSINCWIRSPQKALKYEEWGADGITTDFAINRRFDDLRSIRKAVDCELRVIANDPCLHDCPFQPFHQMGFGHDTQIGGIPFFDWCGVECALYRLKDISQIIKSPWIRPEDLPFYGKVGINTIKLAGREKNTPWIVDCARAYSKHYYSGNIYQFVEKSRFYSPEWKIICSEVKPLNTYVDNRELDGFILPFFNGELHCDSGCKSCGYCDEWAKRAVKIENGAKEQQISNLKQIEMSLRNLKFVDMVEA